MFFPDRYKNKGGFKLLQYNEYKSYLILFGHTGDHVVVRRNSFVDIHYTIYIIQYYTVYTLLYLLIKKLLSFSRKKIKKKN